VYSLLPAQQMSSINAAAALRSRIKQKNPAMSATVAHKDISKVGWCGGRVQQASSDERLLIIDHSHPSRFFCSKVNTNASAIAGVLDNLRGQLAVLDKTIKADERGKKDYQDQVCCTLGRTGE
jgi:hypothetical protein